MRNTQGRPERRAAACPQECRASGQVGFGGPSGASRRRAVPTVGPGCLCCERAGPRAGRRGPGCLCCEKGRHSAPGPPAPRRAPRRARPGVHGRRRHALPSPEGDPRCIEGGLRPRQPRPNAGDCPRGPRDSEICRGRRPAAAALRRPSALPAAAAAAVLPTCAKEVVLRVVVAKARLGAPAPWSTHWHGCAARFCCWGTARLLPLQSRQPWHPAAAMQLGPASRV